MTKNLEWMIAAVIAASCVMAEYRVVFGGEFEPLSLCAGITLLLMARIVHHHLPRLISHKYPRRVSKK